MERKILRCDNCYEPLPASMGKSMTVRPRGGGIFHYCERDECREAGYALAHAAGERGKR